MTFDEADAAYPFDPKASSIMLVGLEKMQVFDDPKMRRNVFDVFSRERETTRERAPRPDYRATPDRTCIAPPDDDSDRRFP